jgi:hypothetical protein
MSDRIHVARSELDRLRALVEQHSEGRDAIGAERLGAELDRVLHPYFVREEEIALPPLGLLEPLSKAPPTKLQLHAKSEEELFYPAALLVGDVVRGSK